MTTLTHWQREVAEQVAAAMTPTTPIRARGVHLAAMNDEPEPASDAPLIERKQDRAVVLQRRDPHYCAEQQRNQGSEAS